MPIFVQRKITLLSCNMAIFDESGQQVTHVDALYDQTQILGTFLDQGKNRGVKVAHPFGRNNKQFYQQRAGRGSPK